MRKNKILIITLFLLSINTTDSFATWIIDVVDKNINSIQNIDQQKRIFWNIWALNLKKDELKQAESLIEVDKKTIKEKKKTIKELESLLLESYLLIENINSSSWNILENKKSFYEKYTKIFELLWKEIEIDEINFEIYKTSILNWDIKNKIEDFKNLTEEELIKHKQDIVKNEALIPIYNEEIKKLETILKNEVEQLFYKIIFFLIIILALLLLKKITNNLIRKTSSLSDERKNVLLSINKILINIFLGLSIFVFFSSEFFAILPFLAILGTAIWFALRDILSNFIAWFVIWLRDSMYKIDDMIEIKDDDIYWKVIEIKLLSTKIQEFGLSWPTWKILYFPNKRIFEKPITNLWKTKWFLFERIDFYLTQESNLIKAKNILKNIMDEVYISDIWRNIKNKKLFAKKYWLSEKSISPFIVVNIKREWVFLRWKTLFNFATSNSARTVIIEKFINQIQKEDDIKLINLV